MIKSKTVILSTILLVSVLWFTSFGAELSTQGEVSAVTVYRGQALVSRTVEVDLPEGSSEVIVSGLPEKIQPESLYAQSGDGLKIMSVRYRVRAVEEDIREDVKKLDLQIEQLENKIKHTERDHQHGGNLFNRYDGFWRLTVEAAKIELNQGLLKADEIESLTEYLEKKWNELHANALKLEDTLDGLKKELDLLHRKREELAAGHSRSEREAVLFVTRPAKGRGTISLSYLVDGANWFAQYNLRGQAEQSKVLIEYNAVINQRSGEDWNGVNLILSTAMPTMVAGAPVLEPMPIRLTERQVQRADIPAQGRAGGVRIYADQSEQFEELLKSRRKIANKGEEAKKELGQIALSNQLLELDADARTVERMRDRAVRIERVEGVSVSYALAGRITLPSRTDQQLVTIAAIEADADFTLIATPLLTDYVYMQADLANKSDTVLLPGQASMFRNGEFTGKGQIPLVTVGETFTAGFGIDSQIQVKRELVEKKTNIQGGNKIDSYNYRLTVDNYKNKAVSLRLLDRLPYVEKDNPAIKVELGKTEPALSKDSRYLQSEREKGILRWDLVLEPDTTGEKSTVVTYDFTVEYDRNMQIESSK
ncbi:MAG: mucoidy inhibitor MuiA family protein [Planctomycetota bacterium]